MHKWGKEGVDFGGIYDAASYIGGKLRTYGRVNVSDMKEKYGTARVYVSFGWTQLHDITHPGYHYIQWKGGHYYVPSWLNYLVIPYQKWLYRYYYKKALKKFPHLVEEILTGADWSELLLNLDPRLSIVRESDNVTVVHWDSKDPDVGLDS